MGERDRKGRFQPGNKIATGRPPREYSVAHALAIAARRPESWSDDGEPVTNAQIAADWLWQVVRTGRDERVGDDGERETVAVSSRDRMHALQTVLARIEPTLKIDPSEMPDDEADQVADNLDNLTDDQLKLLESIGVAKRDGAG